MEHETLALAEPITQQMLKDFRDLAFFVQTVYHLNPIKGVDHRTMQAYADTADRVQLYIKKESKHD